LRALRTPIAADGPHQGNDVNISERSFDVFAPRRYGTPKIVCHVRSIELCVNAVVLE
jgi:hypothetical protein